MKSQMLIIAGVMCTTLSAPAFGVVQCVALNENTTIAEVTANQGEIGWTAVPNGTYAYIQGVGVCSNDGEASRLGETSWTVTASTNVADNKYCWCKMISPAVSNWVLTDILDDGDECHYNCAHKCGLDLRFNSSRLLSGLFSNLSE